MPLVVLTDFEEFRPFRALGRPRIDKPKHGLIRDLDMTFDSYADYADQLLEHFGRESVLSGSIARLVKATKSELKDTVDRAFLTDLTEWRESLARNVAVRNAFANEHELREAVQRILDRIIFIRILEDRAVEPEEPMHRLVDRGAASVYQSFVDLCRRLAPRYNGLLFNPHPLSESLAVDDGVIRPIIKALYDDSPYRFDVIPVEVLGTIYERFLGDEIRMTAAGRAKVEQKPEVRKAGGVYYTPQYVVDYIVERTVGELLKKCRSLKEAADLKILDPACGSGSFLLGAFDRLIAWHEEYFAAHPDEVFEKRGKGTIALAWKNEKGETRLTAVMKGRILKNSIFGVDIDRQATEVAQMSLYIKTLEGLADEPQGTLAMSGALLPALTDNIKTGNSLVGPDFIDDDFFGMSEEERRRINPFDWKREFPFLKATGGFDAVIGNPPYGAEFGERVGAYLKSKYSTFVWRGESYVVFIERALSLTKEGGLFGYIIPDTLLNLGFTGVLRTYLLMNSKLREVVLLPSNVFQDATVDTILLLAQRTYHQTPYHDSHIHVRTFVKKTNVESLQQPDREFVIPASVWHEANAFNVQSDPVEMELTRRVEKNAVAINEIAEMFSGVKAYEVGKGKPPQSEQVRDEKPYTSETKSDSRWSPFYDGKHIGRYTLLWRENNWILYGQWLAAPRDPNQFEGEKILIRKIVADKLIATYIPHTSYCNTLLFILKLKSEAEVSYQALLGILNSKLIGWYFRKRFQISDADTFPQIMIRDILQFPLPEGLLSNGTSSANASTLGTCVQRMLDLHRKLADAKSDVDRKQLEMYIARTDREIDALVYELYGLTEEEIAVVESGST